MERIILWRSIIVVLLILSALTLGIWLADLLASRTGFIAAVISVIAGLAWLPG